MVRATDCAAMVVFPYYRLPGHFQQFTLSVVFFFAPPSRLKGYSTLREGICAFAVKG